MARIARVIVPDFPHHIIQRGNRRQQVFFTDGDYSEYLGLLGTYAQRFNVDILAYCLMPNHVHLIVAPHQDGNVARAIGETHRRYTRFINLRENWRGYLWQGRFSSYVLDERYLLAAIRYILLNPVKAGIVDQPWDYPWSSAKHHIRQTSTFWVDDSLLQELVMNWNDFLAAAPDNTEIEAIQMHERTGRPLGDTLFVEKLESLLKRDLTKKKVGRKKKK